MHIQKQFNHSAHIYDHFATIQKEMADNLRLHAIKISPSYDHKHILDVGCGTGLLTAKLQHAFPCAHICAIDIAANMIHNAQKKISSPNVLFRLGNVESMSWKNHPKYDLITSNAVFQWFQHPEETIKRLTSQLTKKGWIVASTFGPNTFIELTTLFKEVEEEMNISSQKHHLPLMNRDQWSLLLEGARLQKVQIIEKKKQLQYPHCRAFLQSIKSIGASASQSSHPLTIQRKILREVMRRYDTRFHVGDSVTATYHTIYLIGQKNYIR